VERSDSINRPACNHREPDENHDDARPQVIREI
jgi:hypothetical protein